MSFTERKQRIVDTGGVLAFLTMECSSFDSPVRIVNDNKDWTLLGSTYLGIPFAVTLPEDSEGSSGSLTLVMGNVGKDITYELEKLTADKLIRATLLISDRIEPGVIQETLKLPITTVSLNGVTATATASIDYLMRQSAVKIRQTPFIIPGIF